MTASPATAVPRPATTLSQESYYQILDISPALVDEHKHPSQVIKRAYHRALLRHHPDKIATPASPQPQQQQQIPSPPSAPISVDQITEAFRTLSSPALRLAHDQRLLALGHEHRPRRQQQQRDDFQTGVEAVDLDDLDYEEERQGEGSTGTGHWFRGCRCGNARGFRFGEADLEEAGECGELVVGCQDCSLWIKVHFEIVNDQEHK